ncbi:MAG TPA: hypothetical protein VGG20_03505 [Thermoanaerobaculia bacterium]|jgi:hypothetical protein
MSLQKFFMSWRLPVGDLLLLVLVGAVYLGASRVPYEVDSDVAFQLESVAQWVRGDSPDPATLRLPDPRDLSRDSFVASNWWPPAFPYLFAPLAAAGLSLAAALRIGSFALFLTGCLGFLRLGNTLRLPRAVRILYGLSLAVYALTIGGAATLRTVDILAFAAGPWLALMALRQMSREARALPLLLCGLALGATYWVRYALFLAAAPILVWMALRIASAGRRLSIATLLPRWRPLVALGVGFALPILVLLAFNLRRAGFSESVSGKRSVWSHDAQGVSPPFLLLTLAGAPGLSLFQNDLWMTHLTYFSDSHLPFLRGLDDRERLALKALLGIPGTLMLAWGLARARRRRDDGASLALILTLGFYLELMVVSFLVRYNYLANEARLAIGFLPWVQGLALAEWLTIQPREPAPKPRLIPAVALLYFFALPIAFACGIFIKNDVLKRYALHYVPSSTGLFVPEVSQHDVPAVQAAVASALSSPRDVVILAGDVWGGYSGFVPWLEFPQRTFPVAPFFAPLGARYVPAADLRASGAFRSAAPLRVVLVVARDVVSKGMLPSLQARFPAAGSWTPVAAPANSEVLIYRTDLH